MGDRLTITLDNKKVLKHLKAHPKITSLGLVAGINKTGKQATTAGVKGMTKRYTLKASRIKKNIRLVRATRANLTAIIIVKQRRVPGLQNYRPGRKGRTGVTVMVQKGKRKLIRHGFISAGAGGKGIGLFIGSGKKRVPKKGVYKGRRLTRSSPWSAKGGREAGQRMQREFLDRKFGPSVTGMWRRRGRVKARRFARDNIGRIVASEINFRLTRAIKRG